MFLCEISSCWQNQKDSLRLKKCHMLHVLLLAFTFSLPPNLALFLVVLHMTEMFNIRLVHSIIYSIYLSRLSSTRYLKILSYWMGHRRSGPSFDLE